MHLLRFYHVNSICKFVLGEKCRRTYLLDYYNVKRIKVPKNVKISHHFTQITQSKICDFKLIKVSRNVKIGLM